MGRTAKTMALINEKMYKKSKEEMEIRLENEKKLKGNNDKLKPPSYMTKETKMIFRWLVKET